MDSMTKREIERRLKDKGLSNRESKIMVSVLSDTLRDMREAEPHEYLVDVTRFLRRDPMGGPRG